MTAQILFSEIQITDQVLIALIGGMPAMLVALGAMIAAIRGNKKIDDNTAITTRAAAATKADAQAAKTEAAEAAHVVKELQSTVNGRMDELLKAAHDKAYAQGFLDGVASVKKP